MFPLEPTRVGGEGEREGEERTTPSNSVEGARIASYESATEKWEKEVEPPRRRVRAREIKIAVEPLRERVSEMMGRILREEETSRSDEGDKQRT